MRRLGILMCVAMLGCRGLLGIEDPIVGDGGDGRGSDGTAACTGDDYDGDGTLDGCDPCPMYGTADADHDTDGDGVGDGCDPNRDVKGEKRLLWTHFASASDIATWTVLGGNWFVKDGKLQQADVAATGRITPPDTYSNVHIATEIDILAKGTDPYAGACGYIGTNTFKCCDVREMTTAQLVELMAWNHIAVSVTDWTGGLQVGTAFELTNTALNGSHRCFVRRGTMNAEVMLTNADTGGKIALHTRFSSVAYRYLFVVQMPQ